MYHIRKKKLCVATHRNEKLEKLKQIYRQSHAILSWQCLQFAVCRFHLSKAEILWIINAFGCSASNDLSAGFDVVSNIHLFRFPVYPFDRWQYIWKRFKLSVFNIQHILFIQLKCSAWWKKTPNDLATYN